MSTVHAKPVDCVTTIEFEAFQNCLLPYLSERCREVDKIRKSETWWPLKCLDDRCKRAFSYSMKLEHDAGMIVVHIASFELPRMDKWWNIRADCQKMILRMLYGSKKKQSI